MNSDPKKIIRFAEFRLDANKRALARNGMTIPLTAKAFDLLVFLAENAGEIVSKEEIIDAVWKDQFVEETNLTVQISALRRLFGERKGEYNYIVTIPGRGYKFVAETFDDSNAENSSRKFEQFSRPQANEAANPSTAIRRLQTLSVQKIHLFVSGPLLILLSILVSYHYFSPAPSTSINSVAVLPFVNQNDYDGNDYLSDGISENIIYSLSQLPGLRVMSRDSSFRYKEREFDAKSIGGELQVQAIVKGRVHARGDDLVVSAELIDASNNSVLWGEQFNRRITDISTLQIEIARAISHRLRSKLTISERQFVDKSVAQNSEAYQFYLQGLYLLNKRTPVDIQKSIGFFRQAIDRDPAYARGYAGLAMAYNVQTRNSVMSKSEIVENKARERAAALRALEIDDSLAEAHALLAEIRSYEWDFAGSENSFRRAIELNSNLAIARQWYSELLSRLGRHDEAISEIRNGQQLDPLSRDVNLNLALRFQQARRPEEAIVQFKKVTEMEPDYAVAHELMSSALAASGRFEEAIETMSRGDVLFGIESKESSEQKGRKFREAIQAAGARGFWEMNLEYSIKYVKQGINPPFSVATAYARLGDKDRTFEWLEKCFVERDPWIVHLKAEPALDFIASDPKYIDLLRRVGLPH